MRLLTGIRGRSTGNRCFLTGNGVPGGETGGGWYGFSREIRG
jgi:hypothetical protein